MKDFAKSIQVGNSNKAEIIEKKKKEGAILKVDNGQKLEFSDGTTYVKTTGSEDYREAHNHVGNGKVGNASFDAVLSAIQDVKDWAVSADNWANGGKFSATNITSALSHCKNACDKAMRLAQEYDRNSK